MERLAALRPLAGDARVSVQHPIGLVASEADRDAVDAQTRRRFGSWGGTLVGTASELADALGAEAAQGVEGFVLQLSDFGTPATIERFMQTVAPGVRAAGGA